MTVASPVKWPSADILESEDTLYVCFDMSGVHEDDLSVTVDCDRLTVSGERLFPGQALCCIHQLEIDYGPFQRSIVLPVQVNVMAVSAELKNGVLTVTLPKVRSPGRVRITVTEEGM